MIKFRHSFQQKRSLKDIISDLSSPSKSADDDIDLISDLVNYFRPLEKGKTGTISIKELIVLLKNDERALNNFNEKIINLIRYKRFTRILTDSGILKDTHFYNEVKSRLIARILPHQPDFDTLEFILNQVFYRESDIEWLKLIPNEELLELAEVFSLKSIYTTIEDNSPLSEISNALSLISQRVSGRALESDVLKMVPEYEDVESPFEAVEKELDALDKKIKASDNFSVTSTDPNFIRVNEQLSECYKFVEKAYENSKIYGISLKVNQSLLRIRQQLDRISILIPFFVIDNPEERKIKSISLALKLIKYNCYKNNIGKLISESTLNLSYEITKHTAETGEHYITSNRKEYFKMLFTALGGGVIVGFLCIFKLLLSKTDSSEFGYAFLYSMNYSFGFILIYLTGNTLATKQPAMTAATIVKSIDQDMMNSDDLIKGHTAFAELFARLFRSQFIAFVGNIIAAFPVAIIGVYIIDSMTQTNIAEHKWNKLISDISPIESKAIFHAAIAGVFLFLSGVISGSIANRHKHNRVFFRIKEHPFLKIALGRERTLKLANWVKKRWAGVYSNFWFGIFMGSTASIGVFIGLDLDIRHITFASGNFGIALYGSGFDLTLNMIFWSIIGIGIIGFVNFIVSFLLSLGLALKSRNIPFIEVRFLFYSVWLYFRSNPKDFFFPVKGNKDSYPS